MNHPRRLLRCDKGELVHDSAASRSIEQAALASTPTHALMERAGLAVARLALSIAPHAQHIWIAAGPGNNGGDGLVAARWLQSVGKSVRVTCLGEPDRRPADAAHAFQLALLAGVPVTTADASFDGPDAPVDLAIDALLGLGQRRAPDGQMARMINALNRCRDAGGRMLSIDLPTGLCADTGRTLGDACVRADATLALLTIKPGLFTGHGRDAAGDVWWDDLGVESAGNDATSRLSGRADALSALEPRQAAPHASHKGRFGDVWVVGGGAGMVGAAHLAARAGLRAGAGRVYLSTLTNEPPSSAAMGSMELMLRNWHDASAAGLADSSTVVCGCGGGDAVRGVLPELLSRAPRLVLDADALNRIAADSGLAAQLATRGRRGAQTILTPHPLEAARLLNVETGALQADRLAAAKELSERFGAVVVLKGSGSIIAAAGSLPVINASGNARLATAGTGDVLAGWIGGCWSSHPIPTTAAAAMQVAHLVSVGTAWLHGRAVDTSEGALPLPAGQLIEAMAATADSLR